jgi:colicin import membrane protein
VQLQLIQAVRDLPKGPVTKKVVERLLNEDIYQPSDPKPTKAQKAAEATEQHAKAAEVAAEKAEQHAKEAEDAADDAEVATQQAVQELAAMDAAQGSGPVSAADYSMVDRTIGDASTAADQAKEAAAAAKAAAQSANQEGERAVRVAGKFRAAKPHLDSSEASINSANKSAAAAADHAERAATAVTTAKAARQQHQQQRQQQQQQQEAEEEDADLLGAALERQVEQHGRDGAGPAARSSTVGDAGLYAVEIQPWTASNYDCCCNHSAQ